MISVELSEGISETLDILNHMEKIYIDKIPEKFRMFLEKNKSGDYIPNLDHSKKLSEMSLKTKTKDILAILYMKYWCSSKEKAIFVKQLKDNQIKKEKELREIYNPENLFNNIERVEKNENIEREYSGNETLEVVKYKENIFQKLINKIKRLFTLRK